MGNILLADSDTDIWKKMFKETQRILHAGGYRLLLDKLQREDSVNYLGYKISQQQKFSHKKVQIRRCQLKTLNSFLKLVRDINCLWPTIVSTTQDLSDLFQTLQGDSDLSSPRWPTAKAARELTLKEQRLQAAHVDGLYFVYFAFNSFSSWAHSLCKGKIVIRKWIFLAHEQSKKIEDLYRKSFWFNH